MVPDGYPEAAATADREAWFMYDRDCTAERDRALSDRGLLTATCGSNVHDRDDLARLVRTGVDAVCLDDPGLALGRQALP